MATARFSEKPGGRFALIGNELAIDFCNTIYDRRGSDDALESWADLVDFLALAGALDARSAEALRARARRAPAACALALGEALALRATLRRVVAAIAEGRRPRAAWIAAINRALRYEEGFPQLIRRENDVRLVFSPSYDRPVRVLGPIAYSAARLLAAGAKARVRKCANRKCVLYFRDTSRTGRRRWCAMGMCGNRAKVSAYLERLRAKSRPH